MKYKIYLICILTAHYTSFARESRTPSSDHQQAKRAPKKKTKGVIIGSIAFLGVTVILLSIGHKVQHRKKPKQAIQNKEVYTAKQAIEEGVYIPFFISTAELQVQKTKIVVFGLSHDIHAKNFLTKNLIPRIKAYSSKKKLGIFCEHQAASRAIPNYKEKDVYFLETGLKGKVELSDDRAILENGEVLYTYKENAYIHFIGEIAVQTLHGKNMTHTAKKLLLKHGYDQNDVKDFLTKMKSPLFFNTLVEKLFNSSFMKNVISDIERKKKYDFIKRSAIKQFKQGYEALEDIYEGNKKIINQSKHKKIGHTQWHKGEYKMAWMTLHDITKEIYNFGILHRILKKKYKSNILFCGFEHLRSILKMIKKKHVESYFKTESYQGYGQNLICIPESIPYTSLLYELFFLVQKKSISKKLLQKVAKLKNQ